MTRALASFPEEQRQRIATRRLAGRERGNGFWGAKDFFVKKGMRLPGELGRQQELSEALEKSRQGDDAPMAAFIMRDRKPELRRKPQTNFKKSFRPRGGAKLGSVWPKGRGKR